MTNDNKRLSERAMEASQPGTAKRLASAREHTLEACERWERGDSATQTLNAAYSALAELRWAIALLEQHTGD